MLPYPLSGRRHDRIRWQRWEQRCVFGCVQTHSVCVWCIISLSCQRDSQICLSLRESKSIWVCMHAAWFSMRNWFSRLKNVTRIVTWIDSVILVKFEALHLFIVSQKIAEAVSMYIITERLSTNPIISSPLFKTILCGCLILYILSSWHSTHLCSDFTWYTFLQWFCTPPSCII